MNTSDSEIVGEEAPTQMQAAAESPQMHLYCGAGEWYRVAYLNMSDPTEQCPHDWMEYTSGRVRACGRPNSPVGSCPGTFYPLNGHQYSKVCGRVIGYQFGSTDAFAVEGGITAQFTIDQSYVDGVSITHGNPCNHIWSFAAGSSERNRQSCSHINCPCSGGPLPPS